MDKGLTVPKWVMIVWLKIPQIPQNLSAQFGFPSPKILDFNEKRLHWVSVVCTVRYIVVFKLVFIWFLIQNNSNVNTLNICIFLIIGIMYVIFCPILNLNNTEKAFRPIGCTMDYKSYKFLKICLLPHINLLTSCQLLDYFPMKIAYYE